MSGPSSRVALAVPVALVGAVLISGLLEQDAFGDEPARGTLFGLLTTLAYAAFLLVLRHTNADIRRPAGPLFDATLSGAVVAAAAGACYGATDLAPSWPEHGCIVLLAMSSQVVGWPLLSVSLPRLPAALTSVLLTLQPLASLLLGIVLLGEDPTGLQLAGAAFILAGLLTAARPGPAPPPPRAPAHAGGRAAIARAIRRPSR